MKYIVLFGPPGSGKGTQSEKIITKYGFKHISTGEVLRAKIAKQTKLGLQAKALLDKGQLMPDSLMMDILAKTLDDLGTVEGVILDGVPRTIPQAIALKEMLKKRGADVSVMLNLIVPEEELIKRILKRGETSGRSDDNLETTQKRLEVYNSTTAPVIEFYKKEGKLINIEGHGSIDEIFEMIVKEIDKL